MACILFTDLAGSTELLSRLGEAAFDELRGQHFAALRRAVEQAGGTEVKTLGDGLLATFGAAADGVAAAVAVQQAVDRQARTAGVGLAVRVGIALGDVSFEDGDVFGAPVVEAARLVAAAGPGQILATVLVRMVAGGRTGAGFTDVGTMELKGLPQPVAVCEVAWEPETGPALALPPLLASVGRVFVGRETELEQLTHLWKEAAAGERRLALLAGEPGIGKTRLAAHLAHTVHARGAAVLGGRCDEDLGVPYQPFVEALRHYVLHASGPRLGRHPGELTRLVPELPEVVPGLPEPLRSDPETERYRLFDALVSWLADVSAETPLLLVLDDVHWAAKPTLLLLRHMLRSSDPLRLLAVATYRDTDVGRGHPLAEFLADLRRETGIQRISVPGLDSTAVSAFMEAAAGHALDEEGEQLARVVATETEGNAFFVTEVLRHLVESGALEQRDGRWMATSAIDQVGIPEGVRDVVGRRLSRLSETANRVLSQAAVVGFEFEPAVLGAISGLDDDTLLESLEEGEAARLVAEVRGPLPRYRFAHSLVRATLYDELSAGRRTRLHRQVAEAIEMIHAGRLDDQLPALAHHWARAAAPAPDTDKAIDYTRRAGDRALDLLAHDEAAGYYRQALDLLDGPTASPATVSRRLQLTISLGDALRRAGDPRFREILLEAGHLARAEGDTEALARAALTNIRPGIFSALGTVDEERVSLMRAALDALDQSDSPQRARLLAALGRELIFNAGAERFKLAEEALAVARRLGDPETLTAVLLAHYYAVWSPDTLTQRLARTEELQALTRDVEDPMSKALAAGIRYRALMEAGAVDQADRCLDAFEALATDLGQPFLRWSSAYLRSARELWAGQLARAEERAVAGMEVGVATGQPDAPAFSALQMFRIRLEQGRPEEAEGQLLDAAASTPAQDLLNSYVARLHVESGRAADASRHLAELGRAGFDEVGVNQLWLTTMSNAAVVAARLGDRSRAATLKHLLGPFVDQVAGIPIMYEGPVPHFLGLLATVTGGFEEAETHFAGAVDFAERARAPIWLVHTRLEWARMLASRNSSGDAGRSRNLLERALETAGRLVLVIVERQAQVLLDGGQG